MWLFCSACLCFGLALCSSFAKAAQIQTAVSARLNAEEVDDGEDDVVMNLFGPSNNQDFSKTGTVVIRPDGHQAADLPFECGTDYMLTFSLPKTGTTTFDFSMEKLCGVYGDTYVPLKHATYEKHIKAHDTNFDVAEDFLQKVPRGRRVFVVALTRDPWERQISEFFQSCGEELDGSYEKAVREMKWGLSRRCARDHQNDRDFWNSFQWITQTNYTELLEMWNTQVDKYHRHMLHTSMWSRQRQLHVVLMREEDIDDWPSTLSRVFPGFKLVVGNEGDTKSYAHLYKIFKKRYKFSEEEMACLKKSKSLDFYSKDEVWKMVRAARGAIKRSLL